MERMTMTVQELAKEMGISLPIAYKLVQQKGFPVIHVGRRIVIPVAAFQKWMSDTAHKASEVR